MLCVRQEKLSYFAKQLMNSPRFYSYAHLFLKKKKRKKVVRKDCVLSGGTSLSLKEESDLTLLLLATRRDFF